MMVLVSIYLVNRMETDHCPIEESGTVCYAEQTQTSHRPAQQGSAERSTTEQVDYALRRHPCERGLGVDLSQLFVVVCVPFAYIASLPAQKMLPMRQEDKGNLPNQTSDSN